MKRLLLFSLLLLFSNSLLAQGWGQTQKIVPNDRFQGQQFGGDVDIDGDYAVVGGIPSVNATAAYVFENDGNGNWLQIQKLESPDFNQFDHFGTAVAISGDYIFVGAWGQSYDANDANFLNSAGAAYIFKKQSSGLFEFEQKIVASDREALNAFGYGIAIDGDYAIISPVRHDYDASGNNFLDDAGTAYIFEKDSNGIWNEVQKIVASDRAIQDFFGQSALTVDGNFIAVGVYAEDEDENGINTIPSAGSAYIFERDSNGTWNEVQKIVASDRAQGAFFGWSIVLDGNNLVVGANQDNSFTGAAYVFEKNGNGIWNEVQKLTASNVELGARFGTDLDIKGNLIIIGSHLKDIGSPGDDGAAYVFEKETGVWSETAFIYDAFNSTSEYFGFSVAISGDYALVGAYQDSEDKNEQNYLGAAGAAFIFDVNEPYSLSVSESDFKTIIRAYPNPVKNILNIDLGKYTEAVFVHVYNYLGQKIISKAYTNTNIIKLPLQVSKGLYLVEVKIDSQNTSVFKIVKD